MAIIGYIYIVEFICRHAEDEAVPGAYGLDRTAVYRYLFHLFVPIVGHKYIP